MPKNDLPLHVVVGASGPLGTWVVRELLKRGGVRVRAVSRSGGGDHGPDVESVAADASDPKSITRACDGAEVIYHTMNTLYTEWLRTLKPIMEGMIAAAESTGAKLVYGDNVYSYGDAGEPYHEDLPWAAKTRKGCLRKQLLDLLFRAHTDRRIRAAVGMASDFYGPGVRNSPIGEQMIPKMLKGKPGLFIGNPDLPHSYAYIEDFARDLVTLALSDRADGRCWHVSHAPAMTTRDHVEILAGQLNVSPRISALPPLLLSVLALLMPIMREMKEIVYQFRKPFVVQDSQFREVFGGEATDPKIGLQATLEWYKQQSK